MNLGALQKAIDAGKLDANATIDHAALKGAALARGGKDGVRLLAKGELTTKVNLLVAGASKGAVEAVEKAGGKVEVIAVVPAAEKAAAKKGSAKAAKKGWTKPQGLQAWPRCPIWVGGALCLGSERPSLSALILFRMNGVNFRVRQRAITPLRG